MDFSLLKPNMRNIKVHSATSSCSIELYKQRYTLADFLPNWDISRGFLYISLISQDTPPHCDFLRFFLFSIRRKDQRNCDVRGRGRGKLYFTAPVVDGLELYCSSCMPHRRN